MSTPLRVIIYGATGMVGQGVLRTCLADDGVAQVLTVGRRPTGLVHPRLTEFANADPATWATPALVSGYDACFFCLGVSSLGLSEAEYARVTYDLTLAVARPMAAVNPGMTFIYVSGQGTDSTEQGRTMWARVKGRTENALRRLPFRAAYGFRPGIIQPVDGVRSGTAWVRWSYVLLAPVLPLVRALLPNAIVTSTDMGLAMLRVAREGYPNPSLEPRDIRACARR